MTAPAPSTAWSTGCWPRRNSASGCGRHWLDVAGYVDTVGFDTDATNIITSEGKWRYRDYVIRAFNDDKPFDRFITEQLAGDELYDWRRAHRFTPEMREALIATGYLRTARDMTHEDVGVIPQNFFGIMHDTIEIVGTGLLGLTVNCARCHDHKFDPIPQDDYYRLMAIFTPAYNPRAWLPCYSDRDQGPMTADCPTFHRPSKRRSNGHNAEVDRRLAELRGRLSQLRRPCEERLFEAKLATLPEAIRADTKTALRTAGRRAHGHSEVPGREIRGCAGRQARRGHRELEPGRKGRRREARCPDRRDGSPSAEMGQDPGALRCRTPSSDPPLGARQRAEPGSRSAARLLAGALAARSRTRWRPPHRPMTAPADGAAPGALADARPTRRRALLLRG